MNQISFFTLTFKFKNFWLFQTKRLSPPPWISSQIYRDPHWNFLVFCIDPLEIYVFSSIFVYPSWNSNDFYSTPLEFSIILNRGLHFFFWKSPILFSGKAQYLQFLDFQSNSIWLSSYFRKICCFVCSSPLKSRPCPFPPFPWFSLDILNRG